MKQGKKINTRLEILQYATKLFLEKGYTSAYVTTIAKALDISTGNLTFHFPTKEHMLAALVKELCGYQWELEQEGCQDDCLLNAYLLELVMYAFLCEDNPHIRDLIISAYTHSMSLEVIRENDAKRAKRIFGKYCPNWSDKDFIIAQNIVSGVEYSMFMFENTDEISFEERVTSGIDAIMKIYDLPVDIRNHALTEVMQMDYQTRADAIFEKFEKYVNNKKYFDCQKNDWKSDDM